MKRIALIIIIVGLVFKLLPAQIEKAPSILSSSGGYGENESFSISWTLGDIVISTLEGNNLILTQGFQQPPNLEVSIRQHEIEWDIYVYPNPFMNELNIQFELNDEKDFLMEIQDVTGRVLMQETYERVNSGDLRFLSTSGLASGVYFLRILTRDYQQLKVHSISKL